VAIVIDTLNRSLKGSENDDRDMGDYIKAADQVREAFDCAVIIIHHSGIDPKKPRGHTSLTGAADAQLAVRRDGGDVLLRVEWMKDGPQGDEIASTLETVEIGVDEDGDSMTSCVVVASDSDRPKRRATVGMSERLRSACSLLQSIMERDGQAIDEPGCPGLVPKRVNAVKIDHWRKECYLSLPVDSEGDAEKETKRKVFLRVRRDLAAKGVIRESDGWVWLVAAAPARPDN
jgi:AAA domain